MKLVARVNREDAQLLETLKYYGIPARLVRGAVIAELPYAPKGIDAQIYNIPTYLDDASLFIDIEEEGGGMTNTGVASIVCGMSGKPLKPYFVPRGYSNAVHAHFSVNGNVVRITANRADDHISIVHFWIKVKGNEAEIQYRELWYGYYQDLPIAFRNYQAAVDAAITKAYCYHCRHVHYEAER